MYVTLWINKYEADEIIRCNGLTCNRPHSSIPLDDLFIN